MEASDKDFGNLKEVLKGNTFDVFRGGKSSQVDQNFRKKSEKPY